MTFLCFQNLPLRKKRSCGLLNPRRVSADYNLLFPAHPPNALVVTFLFHELQPVKVLENLNSWFCPAPVGLPEAHSLFSQSTEGELDVSNPRQMFWQLRKTLFILRASQQKLRTVETILTRGWQSSLVLS